MTRKTTAYARKRARCKVPLTHKLHIIEGQQRVADHSPARSMAWSLRAALSFDAVRTGTANQEDICALIAVQAIVASFVLGGIATEYEDLVRASKTAIDAMQRRHAKTGSSTINHDERTAIADLLQLHDAIMEIATVKMIEQAHAHAIRSIKILKELE